MPDPESLLPLRPTVFAILAVLHAGKLHGYGIMKRLNESGGMLGPGTLYRTLKEMRDLGLVAHTEAPEGEEAGDERRSYYALTSFGRDVAQAEAERLAGLMKEARLGGVR
jgi:DNA-binding PadR family transcriptional regulator